MAKAKIGLCTLDFHLAGVASLKEKRRILKPVVTRLQNKFNVAVAEVDHQDTWQSAQIAITTVSNSSVHIQKVLGEVIEYIETYHPEALIIKQELEIL